MVLALYVMFYNLVLSIRATLCANGRMEKPAILGRNWLVLLFARRTLLV
jgi:hypothetical protein